MYQHFTKVRHKHNHATRNSEYNFWVPPVKSNQKNTFYYNGIIDWNSLPNNIKCIKNLDRFKNSVNDHLMENSGGSSSQPFLFYLQYISYCFKV